METIANIADLVAALGVIISLLFLAIQIRKNTEAVQAAMYDSVSKSNIEILQPLVEDGELAKNFEKAVEDWRSLDIDHQRRINFFFIQLFRHWESMYNQHQKKTLETWLWKSHQIAMLSYFYKPGVQEWWALRKQVFAKEFRDFLEKSAKPDDAILTFEAIDQLSQKKRIKANILKKNH